MIKYCQSFFFRILAARLERSSFFVAGKAKAKIAGAEGGNSCPNY